jgi:hypothetical protein
MSDGQDDGFLRDSEIALMDAIKTIFEILIAKKVTTPEAIDKMLETQSRAYEGCNMDRALFVVGELRRAVTDPQRSQLRDFLSKPNEGSA